MRLHAHAWTKAQPANRVYMCRFNIQKLGENNQPLNKWVRFSSNNACNGESWLTTAVFRRNYLILLYDISAARTSRCADTIAMCWYESNVGKHTGCCAQQQAGVASRTHGRTSRCNVNYVPSEIANKTRGHYVLCRWTHSAGNMTGISREGGNQYTTNKRVRFSLNTGYNTWRTSVNICGTRYFSKHLWRFTYIRFVLGSDVGKKKNLAEGRSQKAASREGYQLVINHQMLSTRVCVSIELIDICMIYRQIVYI